MMSSSIEWSTNSYGLHELLRFITTMRATRLRMKMTLSLDFKAWATGSRGQVHWIKLTIRGAVLELIRNVQSSTWINGSRCARCSTSFQKKTSRTSSSNSQSVTAHFETWLSRSVTVC